MSFAYLRRHALITAAGVAAAVILPLGATTAVAPASATTAPVTSTAATSVAPLTAAQVAAARRAAATKKLAARKAAAKKRAVAKRVAKQRAIAKKYARMIARGNRIVLVAARYNGRPYAYGASGPRAFDCSGFTSFVVRVALHVNLPRTAAEQSYTGKVTRISAAHRRIGDLIFFGQGRGIGHVAIYAGNGTMWDSPHSGSYVHRHKIHSGVAGYGRVR